MPAAYTNLYIEQGTTYSTTITLDDVYGQNYNLLSYSANSFIRKSYTSSNVTAKFLITIDTTSSTLTLKLDSNTTSNIAPGRYVYDTILRDKIYLTDIRILEGIVDVSPGVTY